MQYDRCGTCNERLGGAEWEVPTVTGERVSHTHGHFNVTGGGCADSPPPNCLNTTKHALKEAGCVIDVQLPMILIVIISYYFENNI